MLRNKLVEDAAAALKRGEKGRVEALRFLVSLIDKRGLQLPLGKMTEGEELAVLKKELKNKLEGRDIFEKADRKELVEQIDFEIGVLKNYLPEDLDDLVLEKMVDEVIGRVGNDFPKVMKEIVAQAGGRADGARIVAMVKSKLGSSGS